MTFASSSVKVLLRKIFFTRRVFPEGRMTPVVGMGGSPSFCCRLSAMTRKTRRPMFILFRENRPKRKKSGPCTLYAKGLGERRTEESSLSARHCEPAQAAESALVSNSQTGPGPFWGQLALLVCKAYSNPVCAFSTSLTLSVSLPSLKTTSTTSFHKSHQSPNRHTPFGLLTVQGVIASCTWWNFHGCGGLNENGPP